MCLCFIYFFQIEMAQSNGYFAILVAILIPSTLSNITLLYFITTKQSLRTVPNIYLGSSLVAQLASLLLVGLHILVHITIPEVTTVSAFFACMTVVERCLLAATVLSFVGLSFERCKYFVKSSTYIPDYRETKKTLVSIWAISIIHGMACLAIGYLAQDLSNPSHQSITYGIDLKSAIPLSLDFLAIFLLSGILMTIQYYRIVHNLWYSPYASLILQKKRKKSVYFLLSITIIQWLMLAGVCLFRLVCILLNSNKANQNLIFLLTLLVQTMSFSVLPSIYLCFSEQTRLQIKRMGRNNRIDSETTRNHRRSTIIEGEISIHAVNGYELNQS